MKEKVISSLIFEYTVISAGSLKVKINFVSFESKPS